MGVWFQKKWSQQLPILGDGIRHIDKVNESLFIKQFSINSRINSNITILFAIKRLKAKKIVWFEIFL